MKNVVSATEKRGTNNKQNTIIIITIIIIIIIIIITTNITILIIIRSEASVTATVAEPLLGSPAKGKIDLSVAT